MVRHPLYRNYTENQSPFPQCLREIYRDEVAAGILNTTPFNIKYLDKTIEVRYISVRHGKLINLRFL